MPARIGLWKWNLGCETFIENERKWNLRITNDEGIHSTNKTELQTSFWIEFVLNCIFSQLVHREVEFANETRWKRLGVHSNWHIFCWQRTFLGAPVYDDRQHLKVEKVLGQIIVDYKTVKLKFKIMNKKIKRD